MLVLPINRPGANKVRAVARFSRGLMAREEIPIPQTVQYARPSSRPECAPQIQTLSRIRKRTIGALLSHPPNYFMVRSPSHRPA